MEERVLSGLKQRFLAQDLLVQFAEEHRKTFNDAAAGACHDRQKAEHALNQVESRAQYILAAIYDGMHTASMKAKRLSWRGRRPASQTTRSPPRPSLSVR